MSSPPIIPEDGESFRGKMLAELRAAHHVAYYQLISVIQACTFAYLIGSRVTDWESLTVAHWIFVASTLLLIVVVWNGYIRVIPSCILT